MKSFIDYITNEEMNTKKAELSKRISDEVSATVKITVYKWMENILDGDFQREASNVDTKIIVDVKTPKGNLHFDNAKFSDISSLMNNPKMKDVIEKAKSLGKTKIIYQEGKKEKTFITLTDYEKIQNLKNDVRKKLKLLTDKEIDEKFRKEIKSDIKYLKDKERIEKAMNL